MNRHWKRRKEDRAAHKTAQLIFAAIVVGIVMAIVVGTGFYIGFEAASHGG